MTRRDASGGMTAEIAAHAARTEWRDLPAAVRTETARAFLNWMGCVLGGCREEATARAATVAGGEAQATVIGWRRRADRAGAAFVDCLASSALAYDDTHLATVTHPTGPVAAALLAHAQTRPLGGAEFLAALALGIEIECRLSNALLLPPAEANLALYVTGLTGPIGGALALGKVMGLDARRLRWAMGLAATQAAGFRATHGSMAGIVVPAFGARSAVFAADLAAAGIDCTETALEDPRGFLGIFARNADPGLATAGLGEDFELLRNAYKPYPAGIVMHAEIDACRDLAERMPAGAEIGAVRLRVHPLTLTLTDRRHPATGFEAQISLQHWAAAVLTRQTWGTEVLDQGMIDDPDIAARRERIVVSGDETLGRDEAVAEMDIAGGDTLRAHVPHARGSMARPMTDAELDAKFLAQAEMVLPGETAARLRDLLRGLAGEADVGALLSPILDAASAERGRMEPSEGTRPCA